MSLKQITFKDWTLTELDTAFGLQQVLAAMLVAQAMNSKKIPIYGLFVVGLVWNFIILEGKHYCISKNYNADDKEIFNILTMMKVLKRMIKKRLKND
ncbi:MAG: hypothetical protein KAG26_05990 [Methylococcales bacterium]|nr:hypothetical protein [Methylococcales bacterium]